MVLEIQLLGYKNGLAKYWHGVSTGYDKDNNITKKVPFFIDRAEKVRKLRNFMP